MKRKMKASNLFFMTGITVSIFCSFSNAFAYKAIGWHWYNELPFVKEKKENKKQQKPVNNRQERSSTTAVAEMKKLREIVEEAKAKAILEPTEANVRDYIALQNHVAAKAAIFSQVWQKVLLDYPELDLRVISPTQSAIQSVVYDEKKRKETAAIEYFSKRYGLLFFYRGSNPLDKELAQVVNAFVQENSISFIPVSVDGKVLELFAESKVNNGQAEKLGIKHFPALILVDPGGKKVKPLNYGFISGAELHERFLQIATGFKGGM
jgi:conjugal transfer pilus assembly protein TraF